VKASWEATVLFPTPPLPDKTRIYIPNWHYGAERFAGIKKKKRHMKSTLNFFRLNFCKVVHTFRFTPVSLSEIWATAAIENKDI